MGHWNQPMKYLEMKNLGKYSSKMNYLRLSLNSKEMLQNYLFHFLFRATFILGRFRIFENRPLDPVFYFLSKCEKKAS